MGISLHEEVKQLINGMATPKMPKLRLHPLCTGIGPDIVQRFHEASTLAKLQRLFLWESAAQEVFVALVGKQRANKFWSQF
jgi:hypothetical protein